MSTHPPHFRFHTLSLHDALPISNWQPAGTWYTAGGNPAVFGDPLGLPKDQQKGHPELAPPAHIIWQSNRRWREDEFIDRKSTRLNSSHLVISYAVFCLKKKKQHT